MIGDERLSILFVTARYLPSIGGVEIHTHEVGRRLARQGHRVTVLTVDAQGTLAPREEKDGLEIVRVRAWPKRRDYYYSRALYDFVRTADVDVVHCHGYYTFVAPLAMLAALRTRLPYVLTFHGRGTASFLSRNVRIPQELALRPLLARADGLIALTKREREFYRRTLRLPASSFTVIPGGVDLVSLEDVPEVEPDPDLIVSVGRAERLKGHQRLIAALPLIASRRPSIKLRICGDGGFASELRRQAIEFGVSDRVEIRPIPYERRLELAETLRRAAVVVALSSSEAQPLAALEACYLGRPLVVAATSGLLEVAESGLAAGVHPDADAHEVAEVVLDQLDHPVSPPRSPLPTWDECVARLSEFYASVLHNRR